MSRLLVVIDVDSTLIEQEAIELLADEAGSGEQVAAVTARAMTGELEFTQSLRDRVSTLVGLDTGVFDRVAPHITLTRGAQDLVSGVHAAGGRVAAVSGGFHELLDPIASSLMLDAHRANRLEVSGGHLTGRTHGTVIDATAKRDALIEWADLFQIPRQCTVVIGDGANDLAMMGAAGLSIAFDATPVVRRHADLVLPDRDLSTVLAVLGLR
jgi:phosphoserine phosphatase